jgi:hypothetical protein
MYWPEIFLGPGKTVTDIGVDKIQGVVAFLG